MKFSKFVFPLFLLISLAVFYPTIGSGFVYDFLGWQRVFNEGSFGDILHCFGYKGNHQVLHFFFYSIYSLFHLQGLPWYLIFCALHAFNGWLLYKWMLQISGRWNISFSPVLIMMMCILFLIHPYHIEAVVWKVCIHYLLSFASVFGILILYSKYIQEGDQKSLRLVLLVYLLSLFLLEISFVTPALMTLLLFLEGAGFGLLKQKVKRAVILAGSMWGLLGASIVLNKLTLGTWVGHYGAKAHFNLDLIGMMSTEIKFLVKHLADARYYSFKTKALLFDKILSNPELTFFMMTGLIALTLLLLIRIKKVDSKWPLAFFCLVASMLYVLPISNLYFFHLQVGMNDRYSYISNTFLWVGVSALLTKSPKWLSVLLMSLVIAVNFYFQQKTIRYWKQSTEVLMGLKDSYRWRDNSHVFILNSPDNLNGIVMASIWGEPSGIDEIIDHQTPKPNTGKMFDVFQYNMTSPDDSVKVEQTGPMQLKVTFNQWGNWWHRNGVGAGNYENEFYKAELLDYPYLITFKVFPEGSAILYQDGKEWKEFVLKPME